MMDELQRIFCGLEEIINEINIQEIGSQIGMGDLKEWCDDTQYGFRKSLREIRKKKLTTNNTLKCLADLFAIIKDVNPKEIGSQIESGNLNVWCHIWQSETKARLAKLAKAVDDEG